MGHVAPTPIVENCLVSSEIASLRVAATLAEGALLKPGVEPTIGSNEDADHNDVHNVAVVSGGNTGRVHESTVGGRS